MSLPEPVFDLAADVLPDAEEHGTLAFAYAHGALLSGFGTEDELGLVCVWDHDEVPPGVSDRATHLTQAGFDGMLARLRDDTEPTSAPLTEIAGFAYGVLMSDDEGAGSAARGVVGEFPSELAERCAKALESERDGTARLLAGVDDYWERAEVLSDAIHRGYVAWFSAWERYFPGRRRRREYAEYFGMGADVPQRERRVWESGSADQLRDNYLAFVDAVLADA